MGTLELIFLFWLHYKTKYSKWLNIKNSSPPFYSVNQALLLLHLFSILGRRFHSTVAKWTYIHWSGVCANMILYKKKLLLQDGVLLKCIAMYTAWYSWPRFSVYLTHGLSIPAQAEPSSGVIMYRYPVQVVVVVVVIDILTITMETETTTDVEEAGGGKLVMN